MSNSLAAPSESLSQLPAWVEQLEQLLAEEFEHLKRRDVAALEQLHAPKNSVLEQLSQLALSVANLSPVPQAWTDMQDRLRQSRQAHFRNMSLMQRQLDAVRGALQALQGNSQIGNVDLYDRLGRISSRSGAWMYQVA